MYIRYPLFQTSRNVEGCCKVIGLVDAVRKDEVPGTPRKMSESVIFGPFFFFFKCPVVRFLELIAKIGIAKIGIAKIGIPIGMDR
jgi:hypothetical protein